MRLCLLRSDKIFKTMDNTRLYVFTIMKHFIMVSTLAFSLLGPTMANSTSPLVYDALSTTPQNARNFRSPAWLMQHTDVPSHIKVKGLDKLNVSASGQFSESEVLALKKKLPKHRLWLVDLRGESHGFINGLAVSWYGYRNLDNQGLTLEEITQIETNQLNELSSPIEMAHILKKVGGEIKELKTETLVPRLIETEKELAKRLGLQYIRLPVLDRHPPEPGSVDDFITLVRSMADNDWLHLHCRAGKGRTTTFIVLYDIILNGTQVGLEDILKRHAYFGPKDLTKLPNKPTNIWKLEPAKQRLAFISDFYQFRNSEDFDTQTWQQWLKNRA